MAKEKVKRKLSAILCADVVEYSRLMAEDEAATLHALKSCTAEIIEPMVKEHNGRIFKQMGDGFFIEFSSAVDSVECAIDWQNRVEAREQPLQFRIGINLGDVIAEDDDVYGDGVNIAARIEKLADPGGICISRGIYDQIKNKINLGFEYLGEKEVKNISEPVRIYKVLTAPEDAGKIIGEDKRSVSIKRRRNGFAASMVAIAVVVALVLWQVYEYSTIEKSASVEKGALPLPDRPSIAVLPFDNMSDDPQQEYFADGISEDIITALSKTPKMFVIARNSSFAYKDKPTDVKEIGRDLGVKYVLEGSVRKSGDDVRITAQLIDSQTGHHVWAEKYDRKMDEIFDLQDEITLEILTAVQVELTEGEQENVFLRGTNNLDAYLKVIEARELVRHFNVEENQKARQLLDEAIKIEPNYAQAYRWLGSSSAMDVWLGVSESPKDSLNTSIDYQEKAISIDGTLGEAYGSKGFIHVLMKKYDEGLEAMEKGAELSPNGADAHAYLGGGLLYTDKLDEAILVTQKAIRLNPLAPSWYLNNLSAMYRSKGDLEEALKWSEKAVEQEPQNVISRVNLTSIYSLLGRMDEARQSAEEVTKLNPKFSLNRLEKTLPYINPVVKEQYIGALREAGLPYTEEKRGLPLPDKPSIAVLPFVNLSDEPGQEFFSDGLTDDIITALSKVPKLFVIARDSVFSLKGKPIKFNQVAEELGVRYILHGSVRKDDNKVRISTQLIDAVSGHHIWAEKYDRNMDEIFAVQDDLTKNIITGLQVKLTEGEKGKVAARGTTNLEAYLKYLQSMDTIRRFNIESNSLGMQLAQEAIDLDPEYAMPYRVLSIGHQMDVWLGTTKSPDKSTDKAMELMQKAIELDPNYAEAHGHLGFIYWMQGDYDRAIEKAEEAIRINPNSAYAHHVLGQILRLTQRYEEAIPEYKKALRLNPFPPTNYVFGMGLSYFHAGQVEKGIEWCEKAVQQDPDSFLANLLLTTVYGLSDQEEKAKNQAAEVLRINPKFSLEKWTASIHDQNLRERTMEALQQAGLK